MKSSEKIDFVVLWVDGNDPVWRAEKEKWEKKLGIASDKNNDSSDIRYRDYGLLKYWFRGVEKFAPWVNKVHFVTCGQIPDWLNTEHPKLHIVKHSDYMPKDALPTFNSNAIEMMMYKIDGLAEQFVLFNDDTLLMSNTKPEDFFKDKKPCNTFALHPIMPTLPLGVAGTCFKDVQIVNKYFDYSQFVKNNFFNCISVKQGKYLLKTLPLLGYRKFPGFATFHMPISYLKSVWSEVWKKESDVLLTTVYHRFRDYEEDYNHWLFNYWQFASGRFKQRSVKFGINTTVENKNLPTIITKQKAKCLNIGDSCGIEDFDVTKTALQQSFNKILPNKSCYEV